MRYNDKSQRTTVIRKHYIAVIIAVICLGLSLPLYIIGHMRYQSVVAHSSSPIGTEMTFSRSSANVKLGGLYTDNENSALVARITVPKTSSLKLPSSGKDYRVFVSSDKFGENVKEMDVLFGRLSTDGDMFLVIPKPNTGVYSVFIMNRLYLKTSFDTDNDNSVKKLDDELDSNRITITRALSEYNYDPNKEAQPYTIKNDTSDMIGFRMTLNPAFDSPEYKPIVLDTKLMEGNTFNFEKMFDVVFKQSAYQTLKVKFNNLSEQQKALQRTSDEYRQRVTSNQSDLDALKALNETLSQIERIDREKSDIAEQMNTYENLSFDNKMLNNAQTKAWVIHNDN